jgi:transposase InsO family protein
MPWKTMDVREQRVQFVVAAARRERSLTALCREFGISRPTGLLWLNRYRQQGVAGIAERSRRPGHMPRLTPSELEQRVVELRSRYPDWGARKLRVLLQRDGVALTHSTIHRILLRRDLVHPADRHEPAPGRFERSRPNELWQMDFKGPKGWNAPTGPLSVLDDHSRYVLVLHATDSTRAELVREQLETAFMQSGVPQAMLMDHGIPWWSARAPTGATELAVWLMKQGVGLHWSGIRHPQTQGKVERFHGELERALRRRGWQGKPRQQWLDEFRWEHNHVRPHEALQMRTPASVWQPSPRVYDPQPPRWEYPAGAQVRKLDADGKVNAYGCSWNVSAALRREWVQLLRIEDRVQVYFCRTLVCELDLGIQRSTAVERWIPE